ncbi:MAG: cupredoxin domain-containing protein [Alloalcanivorax venustensis]|jgi:plastocyanin domain-containing protein|tara:strand:- start:498 stop:857 length:360 start_codon:yes stop_codon:yes gene_type:complete
MNWLINLSGLALMALIVWWFWLSGAGKARRAGHGAVDIIVDDGVYEPAVIESNAGEPLSLRFERRDASPCAEQVVFHGLDVSEYLPVGETTTVTLTPEQPGTYRFTCQMNMYQGKLIVH